MAEIKMDAPFSPQRSNTDEESTLSRAKHVEKHKGYGYLMRDCIIGFADGITVPFALTAGLSSLGQSKLVVLGGLAELFAGSISMGLGAWLAAVTEKQHYELEEAREWREVREKPTEEEEEIFDLFAEYGVDRQAARSVVTALKANEDQWVRFMMDFELKLEKPAIKTACVEGVVMGVSYFIGGLFPLVPYFAFPHNTLHGLFTSIAVTGMVLLLFGFTKARLIGTSWKAAFAGTVPLHSLCAHLQEGIG